MQIKGGDREVSFCNPNLYERYCLPVYDKQADFFHREDKLIAVHMDGRLKQLKYLISRTSIDIVEAFHPEPMGDLPLCEALTAWKNNVIWIEFCGSQDIHSRYACCSLRL